MSELRRFEFATLVVLFFFILTLSAAFIATGHPAIAAGVLAGSLLGAINLSWMVGSARRLMGRLPTTRMLQITAAVRFLSMAGLFGAVLIFTRVDPVGAVVGYGCFPIAAAVAGWWLMRSPRPVRA